MLSENFVPESAASELAKKLPSLAKHDYDTIDKLMQQVAKKHRITGKALHDIFVRKYGTNPDAWIKSKLDENYQQYDYKEVTIHEYLEAKNKFENETKENQFLQLPSRS